MQLATNELSLVIGVGAGEGDTEGEGVGVEHHPARVAADACTKPSHGGPPALARRHTSCLY